MLKNFPFLNYFEPAEIACLETITCTKINHIEYFEQAFTHASYVSVLKTYNVTAFSNERLEFLGDSILELIVSDYLFHSNLQANEGYLSRVRSQFVNRHTLAVISTKMGLFDFLKASFSTERDEKSNAKIMANIFEAVLAAVYLDSGLDAAKSFVYKNIIPLLEVDDFLMDSNYKSILLELFQAESKPPPEYRTLSVVGPDHDRDYTVGVFSEDILIGTGEGKNKKAAEQNASYNALDNIMNA